MKISVIVPAYNCEAYLARCLDSLQRQSLTALEILVCDDCSTDGTRELIKEAAARDPRIRSLSTGRHCGSPAVPRNIGLAHANGEYIGFVDADDWVDDEMFARLLPGAEGEAPDVVSASYFFRHEADSVEKKEIGYIAIEEGRTSRDGVFGGHFSQVLHRIYRTDFLRQGRITFPFLRISEDFCFSAACHLLARRTYAVEGGWYHYNRNRPDSTTRQRQGAMGLDNINFFSDGIRYFNQLGLWAEHAPLILQSFLPSVRYTWSRLDDEYRGVFALLFRRELRQHEEVFRRAKFQRADRELLAGLGVEVTEDGRMREGEDVALPLLAEANKLFALEDYANAIRLYQVCLDKYPELSGTIRFNMAKAETLAKEKHPRWSWQSSRGGAPDSPPPRPASPHPVTGRYLLWPSENKIFHGGRRLKETNKAQTASRPLVTVITTARNAEDNIAACMESVFRQSYPNIEYLVVEAASSDDTLGLIKQHEDKIDYILSEPDSGIYCGLNKGIQLASGDYILVLNADDRLEPDGIEALVSAGKASEADLVFGSARLITKDGREAGVRHSRWDASLAIRCPARHGAMLARRGAYDTVGLYDESLKIIADMAWMLAAFEMNLRVHLLDQTVFAFRQGGISSPHNPQHRDELSAYLQRLFPEVDDSVVASLVQAIRLTEEQIAATGHAYPANDRLQFALTPLLSTPPHA